MAVLFSGTVPIPAGPRDSGAVAVPGGLTLPGEILGVRIAFDGDALPNGSTTFRVHISTDGGLSWRGAAVTVTIPRPWVKPDHTLYLAFSLGPDDVPTHVRWETVAPSAFSLPLTLEVL